MRWEGITMLNEEKAMSPFHLFFTACHVAGLQVSGEARVNGFKALSANRIALR